MLRASQKEAFSDTYFESPSELFFRSAWSCHICSHHEFYKINGSTGVFVKDPENVVDKVFRVSQWRDFIVDFHYGIFVEDSIRTFFTKILMPFSNKQKMHIFLEFILTQNCESNKTLTRTSQCLKIYKKIRQITTFSSKIGQNQFNLTIFFFRLVNYKRRRFFTILGSKLMDAQVGKGGQKCLKLRHAL